MAMTAAKMSRLGRISMVAASFCIGLLPDMPAEAVVGGIRSDAAEGVRASTLRVESGNGELCSGAAIAPRLVLTAAHCLRYNGPVRVYSLDQRFRNRMHPVAAIIPHPSFVPGTTPRTQPGIDLALVQLAEPLPVDIRPLLVGWELKRGERVVVAGFGLSSERNRRTARTLREATLINAGSYTTANTVQVAVDFRRRGEVSGAGACRGDSGGPVLRGRANSRDLVGIVSWSSGPLTSQTGTVCGGFTAFTSISEHYDWIMKTSRLLLSDGKALCRARHEARPNARFSEWFGQLHEWPSTLLSPECFRLLWSMLWSDRSPLRPRT